MLSAKSPAAAAPAIAILLLLSPTAPAAGLSAPEPRTAFATPAPVPDRTASTVPQPFEIAVAPSGPGVSGVPSSTAQSADTLVGTVRSVREGAGVEIVTGFHLALKVVYVRVEPDTRIEVEGRSARLDDLRPGQVVRVRYEETDAGKMAEMIESVRNPGQGVRP